jgi:hypothetical protein
VGRPTIDGRPSYCRKARGELSQRDTDVCQALPFQQIKHIVLTVDAQPSNPQGNALIVLVTGQVVVRPIHVRERGLTTKIDNEPNKQQFSQAFQLVAEGANQFYVFNDVFRLNYG